MKHLRHLVLAVCLIMLSGCATVTPLPSGFDPAQLTWVASEQPTVVAMDGPSGKGNAAGKGALAGAGTGLVYGSLLCATTGLFAPICLGTLIPAMAVGGAGAGALTAAVVAESVADLELKRGFLADQVTATPSPQSRLINRLTKTSSASPNSSAPEWVATIALTTVGVESGQRLFAQATMRLRRAATTEDALTSFYQASEKVALKSDESSLEGDSARLTAINQAFDKLLDKLAQEVLLDVNRVK